MTELGLNRVERESDSSVISMAMARSLKIHSGRSTIIQKFPEFLGRDKLYTT